MLSIRWKLLTLLLAAVSLTAATCNKGSGSSEPAKAPDPAATAPAPSTGSAGTSGGGAGTPAPGDVDPTKAALAGIQGMDFSALSPAAQKELASVFTDEFCYCGCPHSLGSCLKNHTSCRHARRMALVAAAEAQTGTPAVEISLGLSRYYTSFRDARHPVKVDERLCQGSKDAKVTLVEYSDFECPYCRAAAPVLEKLAKDQGAKVRVCYAPFPLPQHVNALPAAQAALFARDHGKFWEMHDALFENQPSLSPAFILQLATRLGLNAADLQKVYDDKKYLDELTAFKESGKAAGLDSTPSIYLNGRKLNLAPSYETLVHTVEDEIEWTTNHNAWTAD